VWNLYLYARVSSRAAWKNITKSKEINSIKYANLVPVATCSIYIHHYNTYTYIYKSCGVSRHYYYNIRRGPRDYVESIFIKYRTQCVYGVIMLSWKTLDNSFLIQRLARGNLFKISRNFIVFKRCNIFYTHSNDKWIHNIAFFWTLIFQITILNYKTVRISKCNYR